VIGRSADQLSTSCSQPVFDRCYEVKKRCVMTVGLPAGPGAASGGRLLGCQGREVAATGKNVVLARIETSPEDLRGMIAAEGILTARGGVSSHAALVARQMGKVCVCGAGEVEIDYQKGTLTVGTRPSRKATPSRSTAPTAKSSRVRSSLAFRTLAGSCHGKTLDPELRAVQVLRLRHEVVRTSTASSDVHQRRPARPG
jgi:phosphohistidine swiveling domain-containing protein